MKKTAKVEYSISDLISKSGIFNDGDWIETKDQDPNGEVRLIQLADIGDGVFIDKSKRFLTLKRAQELKCTFLKKGDILIARMPDPIGRACIFPGSEQPCVTAVDVGIIRPENNAVHNEWLKYKINSPHFRHLIREYTTGTTRKRISRKNLDKITFELPSYADQIKIVQILSKAEKLVKDRKVSIDLLDELVEAKFLELFGNPNQNSKGFTKVKFSELAKIDKQQVNPDKFKKEDFYIGLENIEKDTGRIIKTTEINPENLKSSKFSFSNEHILYGKLRPYLNKVSFPDKSGICSTDIYPILPLKKELKSYIGYLMKSKFFVQQMTAKSSGANLPRVSQNTILTTRVYKPAPDLLRKFDLFVEKIHLLKNRFELSLSNLDSLFNITTQLAFKGKLDLSSIDAEQQELKQIKIATDFFAQQTKLLDRLAPLTKLQQTLDKITKSTQVFKSFEAVNKAFVVNKLPHMESLKRFEEFMVNSGIGRLDEINSYQEYLDVMNLSVFKQLDITDKFRIKGLEHFHERYLKELKELERKRRKEEAKSYHGKKLDEEFLITILKKDFKGPFKAEILYEYLKQLSFDFNYDHFVNLIFGLLKGKKPILKQKCIETHIHEMAIPIMDLLPELQEAQKRDGLYLMLNKE